MRVSIVFRNDSGHESHARQLANEIKKIKGIDAELVHGSGDVFDVRLDGDLIYSKAHTGKFPEIHDLLGYMGDA